MASKSDKPASKENNTHPAEEALSESQAEGVIDVLDRNRNLLLIGIIAIAVAIGAFLLIREISKQKHAKAGAAFSAAASSRDIAALDGVVVEFPGSVAAGNALITKSEIQIDQGKAKDAQSTLETFVGEFKSHPRHHQGLFALGNLHHMAGDKEKAKSLYEQSIAEQADSEYTPLSRIRLGDLALEAGDKEKADQYYQDSFIKHPGNPFASMAEEKIALLKIGNPPVVDPPKPPAPPKKKEEAKPKITVKKKPANPKPATSKPANADKKAPAKPKASPPKSAPQPKAAKPTPPAKPVKKLKPAVKKPAVKKAAVKKAKVAAPKVNTPPAPKKPVTPKAATPPAPKKPAAAGN